MILHHQLNIAPVRSSDAVPSQQRFEQQRRERLERMHRAALAVPAKPTTPRPLSPFNPLRTAAETPPEVVEKKREVFEQQRKELKEAMAKVAPWSEVLDQVAAKHGIRVDQILSRDRTRLVAAARRECCYRLSADLDMTMPAVGRRLGIDHSTVLYAVRTHLQRHPELAPVYADKLAERVGTRSSLYRKTVQMYFDDNRTVPEIMRELSIDRNMVNSFIRSEVRKVRQQHTGAPG